MVWTEPLRELTSDEEIGCLLQALSRDMPHAVHMVNMIATLSRWRREGCKEVSVNIYRAVEEGDATEGSATAVVVLRLAEGSDLLPFVSVHSTACGTALRRVLEHTKCVPWHEDVLFEGIHERYLPALVEVGRVFGDPANPLPTNKMYLPAEEALRLDVSPTSADVKVRPLRPEHAAFVHAVHDMWPYKFPGSEILLDIALRWNPGLCWGAFVDDDEGGAALPVAVVMTQWFGGLGILHTVASHRRRGLGSRVTRAACRALAERTGMDAHCNVRVHNAPSDATLTGLGFRRVCGSFWVHYKARPRPCLWDGVDSQVSVFANPMRDGRTLSHSQPRPSARRLAV